MKSVTWLFTVWFLAVVAIAESDVRVAVESGDEVAFPLTARWLHGLSIEQPSSYHAFLKTLTKLPIGNLDFAASEFAVVKGLNGKAIPNKYHKISPLFTRLLKPKEVQTFIEHAMTRSLRTFRSKPELKSLELAIVSGRANDDLHYMHTTWAAREAELADSRDDCQSWIDVRGHKACSVGEFWSLVGKEQKKQEAILRIRAEGTDLEPLGYDVPSPLERNATLPFLVLYGSTTDEEFPSLYETLYSLSVPSKGPPRAQFAVRWKPDTTVPSRPNQLAHFSAEISLDAELPHPESIDNLRIRAIDHITKSDNPLQKLIEFVTETPLMISKLAEVDASVASATAQRLDKDDLQPSFTVNGVEIDLKSLDMSHLLETLRLQRTMLMSIYNDHLGLNAGVVRAMATFEPVESTLENEPELINLAHAVEGIPRRFSGTAFLEGDASAGEAILEVPGATVFLIADLNSKDGRQAAKTALTYIASQTVARLSLVHNPVEGSAPAHAFEPSNIVGALIDSGTFAETFASELSAWLALDVDEKGSAGDITGVVETESPLAGLARDGASAAQQELAETYWQAIAPFARRIGIAPGETAFLVNGRVERPKGAALTGKMLRTTVEHELKHRIQPIVKILKSRIPEKAVGDRFRIARLYMMASSIIAHDRVTHPYVAPVYQELPSDYPHIVVGAHNNQSLFEIAVVADPLNSAMRYWAPMLDAFKELAQIRIYFAKWAETGSELFESVYKASVPSKITFGPDGEEETPTVTFSGLPKGEHEVSVTTDEPGMIELIRDETVEEDGIATRRLTYRYIFGPEEDEDHEAEGFGDDDGEPAFTLRPDVPAHNHDEL